MLEWDARKFQTLYATFVKRKAAEELEAYKLQLIGGIWSNSNWDSDKDNPRQEFIETISKDVEDKIGIIYGMKPEQDEAEIDETDPFWSAMYRGLEKLHGTAKPTKDEVDRAIAELSPSDNKIDIDQIEE